MSLSVLSEARTQSGMPECGNNGKKKKPTYVRTEYLTPRPSSACPDKTLHISKLCLRETLIPDFENMINLLKLSSFFFIFCPQFKFMYFKILGCLAFFVSLDIRKLNFIGNLKIVGHVFIIRNLCDVI